ncbi:MAG: glycosyltransferase family 4 protein [Pseudomonadota bacterium]
MTPPKITIVSPNASQSRGGEAMLAYQFFCEMSDRFPDVSLLTHERCRDHLTDLMKDKTIYFAEEDWLTAFMWRSVVLRPFVDLYFQYQTRKMIPEYLEPDQGNIIHYVCPVSPVLRRLPPKGYRLFLGPLTGNIAYPPGFAKRESRKARLRQSVHFLTQWMIKVFSGEKRRYERILIAGYERTRASVIAAGASEERLVDVICSGVSNEFDGMSRTAHSGVNNRFMCSGRFVDHKGMDLAIRAVAEAGAPIELDLYGDGECGNAWRALARELGVEDRVTFKGWLPKHADLLESMRDYRGYLFPTLAEAHGIVMQEAMMVGLPVITLRWGGPIGIAGDDAAIFIEPENEAHVVSELAKAMTRLANDPEEAERISATAHKIADEKFRWRSVIASWIKTYDLDAK